MALVWEWPMIIFAVPMVFIFISILILLIQNQIQSRKGGKK